MSMSRFGVRVWVALSLALGPVAHSAAHPSQAAPSATPQQVQIYEAFRAWINAQPVGVQRADDAVVWERYSAELRRQGKAEPEITSTIAALRAMGDRAEVERWNRILTSAKPMFNTAPNAFLVEMTKGPARATPGRHAGARGLSS